jgi:hypothetical protein
VTATVKVAKTMDSAAWCKQCDWERQGPVAGTRYALTVAARYHVRRTGHTVEVERMTPIEVRP